MMKQLEFNFDADPVDLQIEALIGQAVRAKKLQKSYRSTIGNITHYYALTDTGVYDISLSDDPEYNCIFARYERAGLEQVNSSFGPQIPLLERIFGEKMRA